MGFYSDHIEPALVSCACGMKAISREREKIVPAAAGKVLEVGFGSGLNAPYYDQSAITHLYALEPSAAMRARAAKRIAGLSFPLEWLDLPGEEIPLPEASVDTVLVTYTLCTIPGVEAALQGMRRVLKPGGKMIFLEHGLSPDAGVAKWQNRLDGIWGKLAGGCHLNRDPASLIREAGFKISALDQHYAPGAPKFAGYMTGGVAAK
ncbi:class I SAM-dependent methyltransferase [Hyphococcus luteus]|uniref:SAM-dependent methyltransferase n=1 Tax=Hyphococcus luteus TaxID=2058213 RepID=A0A2S7K7H5_9PROT|nr:class I SAM-dependent methyltransferase [Marinicaulis flavus]PQA88418.1 SAM-dependent methyltransferase [Marinicaulis flavus]